MADNASETAWEKEAMIDKCGFFYCRCFFVVVVMELVKMEDSKWTACVGEYDQFTRIPLCRLLSLQTVL